MSLLALKRHKRASAFTPLNLSGIVLWLRADLGVTSSTTFTWADQSGTGDANKNCTSVTVERPTLNASDASFNNQPSITFLVGQCLRSGTWAVPLVQPFTEFVVCKTGSGSTAIIVDNAADSCALYSLGASAVPDLYAGSDITSSGNLTASSVLGAIASGASSQLYYNSHAVTGSGNAGVNGRTSYILAKNGSTGLQSLNGKICEVIDYNRALSGSEIVTVMNYLGSRYGIPIS